jgi:phage tail sheath gpL-like
VLNAAASPVTAVVASGGTTSAASVMLTTKATGAGQNGAIKLALVSQVKAAPASLTGGAGTTYDTGTVSVTISNTTLSTSYGQTSTVQTVAQGLASAIDSANLGVTASAGSNGALMVTANQPGTADNGMTVALSSSTSEPALFSSPSFSGTSGTLSGGVNPVLTPGTIYSYSIPATPTPDHRLRRQRQSAVLYRYGERRTMDGNL